MGSTARTVLLTGVAGFTGGWTARELRRALHRADAEASRPSVLRLLTHRRPVPDGADAGPAAGALPRPEHARGDLTDRASLRGLCDGVDTLVHLAVRVGEDEEEAHAVNVEGTRNLLAEAGRAGVRRIVQLGTAAVYRDGAHRGAAEGELATGPVSVTSRTRLAGEQLVLAAGGTVLRPHLIYGAGDTWFVPALAQLIRGLPHWVDGGRARLSLVAVDDLARVLAALAVRPGPDLAAGPASSPAEGPAEGPAGRVLHAGHPVPVTTRELVTTVATALELPLPEGDISMARALELLGGATPVRERRLSLLAVDHWYDSSRLWAPAGCDPGPGFAARFADHAPWYRAALGVGSGAAPVGRPG
ncbi:NAD(P)-dependent oxidoreductase [Kitasatospora sp. NBC_00240]|uniref:NAD-dependent epimerase/dehydratase family protein n=1 Tax=Kitasatospora sp. NBC_00240 TaxID=2903567 RepID=UPI002256759D|nr:NAD(P)-dependent oxidoreductase [Kitasatospora sp. NBC_00240]MCX5212259.1 NAD(P)-dependent oxidoreductase [Kitasatospora sp. NBC_00240]